MYSRVITQLQSGVSAPVYFDTEISPFNVGIGCVTSGGVNTYTIQHTFDDLMLIPAASCTWFNSDLANLVGATTNQDGNYAYPVKASRLNLTSLSTAAGSMVKVTYIQAGVAGG